MQRNVLKKWARGERPGAVYTTGPGQTVDAPEVPAGVGDTVPQNRLWAGDIEKSERIDEGEAEDMWDWLLETEPELADPIYAYGEGYLKKEPKLRSEGRKNLKKAQQYLIPEYPEFTDEQREMALANIEYMIRMLEPRSDENAVFRMALGKGVAGARAGQDLEALGPDTPDSEEDNGELERTPIKSSDGDSAATVKGDIPGA